MGLRRRSFGVCLSSDTMSWESSRVCAVVGFMVSQVVGDLVPGASSRKYKQSRSFFYSLYPHSSAKSSLFFLFTCLLYVSSISLPPLLPFLPSLILLLFSWTFPLHFLFVLFCFSFSLPSISPPDLPLPHSHSFITSAIFPNPSPSFPLTRVKIRAACSCHGNTSAVLQPFPGSRWPWTNKRGLMEWPQHFLPFLITETPGTCCSLQRPALWSLEVLGTATQRVTGCSRAGLGVGLGSSHLHLQYPLHPQKAPLDTIQQRKSHLPHPTKHRCPRKADCARPLLRFKLGPKALFPEHYTLVKAVPATI